MSAVLPVYNNLNFKLHIGDYPNVLPIYPAKSSKGTQKILRAFKNLNYKLQRRLPERGAHLPKPSKRTQNDSSAIGGLHE